MLKKLKEKNGSISVFVIIILVFLLPFAIWVGIELPKTHELNQRVKDAVDSASASAVTSIDSASINGDTKVIPLNEMGATGIAVQIFASKMGLDVKGDASNIELTPPEGSIIQNAVVQVAVLDEEDGVTGDPSKPFYYQTKNGRKKIENSTVIVTATVTYEKIGFLGRDITVTHVGMSQAKMNPNR